MTQGKIAWHCVPYNLASLVMNIFCYFILHTTRESLGGISQYQRKHYCVPLTYFTYLTPLSISSGSRTVIVCGIPDPLTAESTLEKLLTALVLLFTPLMVAQTVT